MFQFDLPMYESSCTSSNVFDEVVEGDIVFDFAFELCNDVRDSEGGLDIFNTRGRDLVIGKGGKGMVLCHLLHVGMEVSASISS